MRENGTLPNMEEDDEEDEKERVKRQTTGMLIQRGFSYSNHLNTKLVWYSNGRFVSGCEMVRYSNGGLKTGLKKVCLWSKMSGI